jgi:hypothetical protein
MARQRDSKLVGTVGNLIFYNHRGDYRMRTKPVSVKRSDASIKSGLNFGKASKISRQIRSLIASINPSKSDNHAMYRFTGALNKFISWKEKQEPGSTVRQSGTAFINGFQFNDHSDLTSITAIQVSVKTTETGLMEISFASFIPGQSLHAPYNSNYILLKIILTRTNLAEVKTEKMAAAEIEIPYSNESFLPPVISMPVIPQRGSVMMMIIAVQYMVNRKEGVGMLKDLKKLPLGIAWVSEISDNFL